MAEKCCCEQCAHRRKLDAEVIEGYRQDKIRLAHEVDCLRGESASLQADASRYRALRALHWYDSPLAVVRSPKAQVKPGTDCPSEDRLDEAVDALILEKANG